MIEAKTFVKFDVTPESEKRFTISREDFQNAVKNGDIKIYDIIDIEQRWLFTSKKYCGRIRKSVNILNGRDEKTASYEHTVKHHVYSNMDYEVTTKLSVRDYDLLGNLYGEKVLQKKTRVYVNDKTEKYEDYIITVDLPEDKKDICWVEFELKPNEKEKEKFRAPEWIKEI